MHEVPRLRGLTVFMRSSREASAAKAEDSTMRARRFFRDTLLERLSQDLEAMALKLGPLIQAQNAVMRQEPLPQHGHLPAADHAHIGDGVMPGAKRTGDDDGGAPTRQAGDAVDPGGLPRCRQAHRRQDGSEAPRQP